MESETASSRNGDDCHDLGIANILHGLVLLPCLTGLTRELLFFIFNAAYPRYSTEVSTLTFHSKPSPTGYAL